ncbi:hypothetical protein JOB18_046664 [Solea senegalensis]|uniref:Reverse transcriptase/retrotransposon-derived protein RNase H-like domain-containing protein n=1 Tax=Solea senegalensis TaxID=28829 RepID=A0AAV6R7B7_SOLSE|nr:hypothetical protein JOB18_046664 [Solea senegalensis]
MKFIPNYANLSEPLRKLTRQEQVWEWTSETERSFQEMKEALVSEPRLAYFKLGAATVVISDASSVGLGAVLLQSDGQNKPIACASRSLTPTERHYSKIERNVQRRMDGWIVAHGHKTRREERRREEGGEEEESPAPENTSPLLTR